MITYTQMAMAESLGKPGGSNIAGDMMGMQMGMQLGQQMMNNMNNVNTGTGNVQAAGTARKFCPECGSPVNGAKFCPNCGTKLV